MNNQDKTKDQLIADLEALRKRNAELEAYKATLQLSDKRQQTLQSIRDKVWKMKKPDDIVHVADAIKKGLEEHDVHFTNCGINVVDPSYNPPDVYSYNFVEKSPWTQRPPEKSCETIIDIWRKGVTSYRKDLDKSDIYGEKKFFKILFDITMRSVIDVPFSHGTLAVSSQEPEAFTDDNILVLQDMAHILSEGFKRMEDLRNLENYSKKLENKINDLMLTDDALLKERDRAQRYLDLAGVMFVVIDVDQIVTLINSKGCQILGDSEEAIVGKNWFDNYLPARFRQEVKSVFTKIITGELEPVEYFENPVVNTQGEERLIAWHNSLLYDDGGNITGTLSSGEDITDRNKAEEQIVSLAKFPEENPNPVLRISHDGKIVFANEGSTPLLDRFKCRRGGVLPDEWLHIIKIDTKKTMEVECDENVYSLMITPVKEAGYFNIYGHDITEQKRLEKMYFQSQKMESVGRLAGGIAHDFNNILTAILGNADLALMLLTDDDPLHSYVTEISHGAVRAATLTRQLLAFSRRQIIEPRLINLNNLLINIEKMLRRLIGEDLEFVILPADGLWQIHVDPGQIEQVLTNLVVNARDAMPDGGKLTIETANITLDEHYARTRPDTKAGDYIMLVVSDNGTGMDKETLSYIFEPFFTTKETGKGTGLGLSTCYGIVKQNNGNIWAYSEPGVGTTIKVYLPKADSNTKIDKKQDKESSQHFMGTETLLIVEDEPSVLGITAHLLRDNGYSVFEATNGEEAIRVMENSAPDSIHLIITDVVMPRMGGKELGSHVKKFCPGCKILYMSGYTDNSIVHHGILESGMTFLQKPFSSSTLLKKVRQVLDS